MKKSLALLVAIMLLVPMAAFADVPAFEDIQFSETAPAGIYADAASLDYSYDDMTEKYAVEILTTNYGVQHKPKEDDPILQYLNKAFNLDITLTAIPGADVENTLSTRFAADDAPDVFVVDAGGYRNLAFTLSNAGLLIDAKELYPYMPLHQKYTTAGMIKFSTNTNGEIPFVTKYGIQDGIWCGAIRSDWLKTLGMEMPKTKQELLDYAVAVTTKDPDGNGQDDTYFMTGAGGGKGFGMLDSLFGTMAGPNQAYVAEDGTLQHPYFDGTRKEFLSFVKELYDLKVLAPDWYTIDWETAKSYTLNDKIGMVNYPAGSLYQEYTGAKGSKKPEVVDVWKFMPDFPIEGGKYSPAGNPGYMIAFAKAKFEGQDGKLKRVLHMIDTMAAGGENFSHTIQNGDDKVYEDFGLELISSQNVVYTDDGMFYLRRTGLTPEGALQFPYTADSYGELTTAAWQNFGLNVSWQLTDPENEDPDLKHYAEVANEATSLIAGVDRWPNYGLAISLSGEAMEAASTLGDFVTAAEFEFATGARSLDEYDAWAQEWLSKGGKAIIQQTAECLGCEVPEYAK